MPAPRRPTRPRSPAAAAAAPAEAAQVGPDAHGEGPGVRLAGGRLLFEGDAPPELIGLALDGRPLGPPATPSRLPGGGHGLDLPAAACDGRAHRLELTLRRRPGAPPLRLGFDHRSRFRWQLDPPTGGVLSGWIHDEDAPGRPVTLEVRVEGPQAGRLPPRLRADHYRDDLAAIGHPTSHCGFRLELPPAPDPSRPSRVTLLVAGTDLAPFGIVALQASGAAHAALLGSPPSEATARGREAAALRRELLRPALAHALAGAGGAPPRAVVLRPGPLRAGPRRPAVDVVVPVHGGREATLACLDAAFAARCRIPHRIVVVDDAIPDPVLKAEVAARCAAAGAALLVNPRNLGFVGAANRGIAHDPDRDVVLLNSDTLVSGDWLDRLHAAAHSAPDIASVTPFSNDGAPMNLPGPVAGTRGIPLGLGSAAELDALCAVTNPGSTVELPTGNGFCLYLRRDAIEAAGLLDEAAFGLGYGEENDWCRRAAALGWRHLGACDVFVFHEGGASFGAAKQARLEGAMRLLGARHPDYHALVAGHFLADPAFGARNALQKAAWRAAWGPAARGPVVFLSHGMEGGVRRHVDDLGRGLSAEGWDVLSLEAAGPGWRLREIGPDPSVPAGELRYPDADDLSEALADILALRPALLHLHHLIDMPAGIADFLRGSGIPYLVTLHDYLHGCPRVTMLDARGTHCALPGPAACNACLAEAGPHPAVHPTLRPLAEDIAAWRAHFAPLLAGAAGVIAPSEATAALHRRMFPGLEVQARPHPAVRPALPRLPVHAARAAGPGLRVAVLGATGPHKGSRALADLAWHCARTEPDIRLVVVGHTDDDAALRRAGNVEILGPYLPENLAGMIAGAGCRVALFLSPWPETWCYTLSEALEAGLVPVALDAGAIGERLRALRHGALLPVGAPPPRIVAALRTAAERGQPILPAGTPAEHRYAGGLMRDYLGLPAGPPSPPAPGTGPRLLLPPEGVWADGWCGPELDLAAFAPGAPAVALRLVLWCPEEGFGQWVDLAACGAGAQGGPAVRHRLAPGAATTLRAPLPAGPSALARLSARFGFALDLPGPDGRAAAARLEEAWLELEDGAAVRLALRAGPTGSAQAG